MSKRPTDNPAEQSGSKSVKGTLSDSPGGSRAGTPIQKNSRPSTPQLAQSESLVCPGQPNVPLPDGLKGLGFQNPLLPCAPSDLSGGTGWTTLKELYPLRYLHYDDLKAHEKEKVAKFTYERNVQYRNDPRAAMLINELEKKRTFQICATKDEEETKRVFNAFGIATLVADLPIERTFGSLMNVPYACMFGGKEGKPDVVLYLREPDLKAFTANPSRKSVASRDFLLPFLVGEYKDGAASPFYASPQTAWAQMSAAITQLAAGISMDSIIVPAFTLAGPVYAAQVLFLEKRIIDGISVIGFVVAELDAWRVVGNRSAAEHIASSLCGMVAHYKTVTDLLQPLVLQNLLRTMKAGAGPRGDDDYDSEGEGFLECTVVNSDSVSSPVAEKSVKPGAVVNILEQLADTM
ncbi:hypothetical protein HK097_010168 [Rhizophlyctis rosea]|uniref:Uncharacterized protein n=1 Tax=Rhizophlyctis rosea TaxID=64517 RepID=A0AAD5S7X2_9FUNG|nr:hypothetical protein HK097_010168 [Rhizophlyctis rosea]